VFHDACIGTWIRMSNTCPFCRSIVDFSIVKSKRRRRFRDDYVIIAYMFPYTVMFGVFVVLLTIYTVSIITFVRSVMLIKFVYSQLCE